MWKFYDLAIKLDHAIVGGIPKHPEIVKRWQEAHWPEKAEKLLPADPKSPEEAAAQTLEMLGEQAIEAEEKALSVWTGFVENGEGLCIENRNIKAGLKESANIVRKFFPSAKGTFPPLKAQLAE